MEARQERGLQIANRCYIGQHNGYWFVPSQSGQGRYRVDSEKVTCTCPDYETRSDRCKHIYAVEYIIEFRRENGGAVSVMSETLRVSETVRKTYTQNWPAYNKAQVSEKQHFQQLLSGLCANVAEPPQTKGRPRIPLSDAVFAATFKIYSTFSGRRFMTDLTDAKDKGFISTLPHYNSIFNYLENPDLTPILRDLITRSALPLKSIETEFAVDSTGFMTSRFTRWFDKKYGTLRQEHDWVKAHIICGVKTNVVTAVEIHERYAADAPILPSLVSQTAKNFTVKEVSADKGYTSAKNLEAVAAVGATPYIAFRANATGVHGNSDVWTRMFQLFLLNREEFFAHYHKRSNVESTMMMIKTKFRDHVRSKTDVAMRNEVLGKILCHNICCLIGAIHELGIDPTFGTNVMAN